MNDELKTKEGRLLAYINYKAKSLGITIEELKRTYEAVKEYKKKK